MAGVKYLAEQAEEYEDELYEPPEEFDIDAQNPNMTSLQILCKEHHGGGVCLY
jgi:hypothetical protein